MIKVPIKIHTGYHLDWADEDRTIALAMIENGVFLVNVQSTESEPVRIGDIGKDEAWGVASIPAAGLLLVSYIGGEIKVWDVASRLLVGKLTNPPAKKSDRIGVGSMSVSPDHHLLATSSGDGFVAVYDLAGRAIWQQLETQSPQISRVAFSPDGQKLAALGSDNRLYIWLVASHSATLYIVVNVILQRAVVGDATHDNEHATWLDWMSDDQVAIAVSSAAIGVIGVDPNKWLKRIDGLALASGKPIN
jgi:WD40 repeat protein